MRKLAILGLALVPVMSASAQKQMPELTVGLASVGIEHVTGNTDTHFSIGAQGLALGFYLSSGMAIEPMVSLDYTHFGCTDCGSATSANIGVGVPFYMNKDWGHTGLFVEPRAGLRYEKETGTDAATRLYIGGSVGYKMKVSDHVSTRLEGVVTDLLKKDWRLNRGTLIASFAVLIMLFGMHVSR